MLLICVPVAATTVVALAFAREDVIRSCTLMATYSGVQVGLVSEPAAAEWHAKVLFRRIAKAHPRWTLHHGFRAQERQLREESPWRSATICAGDECVSQAPPFGPPTFLAQDAKDHQWLAVRVILAGKDGTRTVLQTSVVMRKVEINGPGCGVNWQASVGLQDGRLVVAEHLRGL